MKTIKELKAEYDSKSITEIEQEAKKTQGKAKEIHAEFIEILFYMERTGRYKENALYKNTGFPQYIEFQFGIRWATYHETRLALGNFPDFSKKYSPALVTSIKSKCGAKKTPAVIKQIEAKQAKRKTPLVREEIQEIVDKYRKPVVVRPKPDIRLLKDQAIVAEQTVKEQGKVILTKDEQIVKLKATVKRLTAENAALRKENDELKAMMNPIATYFQEVPEMRAVAN